MSLRIRPTDESDADYEATAAIWTANWPEHPKTAEMYRYSAKMRAEKGVFGRLIAEEGGDIAGTGYFREESDNAAEGKFLVYAQVAPERQGRRIGSALFNALVSAAAEYGPRILSSFTREDREVSVAFLERRGFRVSLREQNSELDLSAWDARQFDDVVRRVRESGIEIVSASELAERDPGWRRRAWALHGEIIPDVPDDDLLANEPFVEFEKSFDHPDFVPDGYFVALDGKRLVGMSSVWNRRSKPGEMYTRLTGVVRSHRRRGIATALKVRAHEFAKSAGAATISTDNEENNPMFALNLALGFIPTKAWLQFRSELGIRPTGGTP